jgi:hypothetical protein
MAKAEKSKRVSSTERERQELLHRLWLAQTRALVEKIETTPATDLEAATLNVARQVLSDNGITTDTITPAPGEDTKQARIMRESLSQLPNMDALSDLSSNYPAPDFETAGIKYK